MIYLFIDTSISYPTISLINDNKIFFEFHDEIKYDMSSRILPIIKDALSNNNLSLNSVDKIFVVIGPGSFTGVRIGVTIAKTIAWCLNKKIIPLSSLEYMASINTDKKYVVPMIDARRNNVFAGIYDNNLNLVKKDCLINLDDLLKEIKDDEYTLLSYDSINNSVKPKPDVIKVINKHLNDVGVNPHEVKPNYLKLTEAEENRLKND